MSPPGVSLAAVDLGASSGRVLVGRVDGARLELTETLRFANTPVHVAGTLHWDVLALYRGMLDGIRLAGREAGTLDSIGIDSWAVDYGLLDSSGALLGNPVHYRDARTNGVMDEVVGRVTAETFYSVTGLQFLPFNTVYQLCAALGTPQFAAAETLLLMPDLMSYWLTGEIGAELTNASTTQLLDVASGAWSTTLLEALGIPARVLPPIRRPGERAGLLTPDVLEATGLSAQVPVTTVGSHDTASAVVGVPAAGERFGYISCGTWSLVGVELDKPVLTEASRLANFTNEVGVDATIRYLRNVMGLWLLQECMRTWDARGAAADVETLLREAAGRPAFAALVNPDDQRFLAPGDMPSRIAEYCTETGQQPPQTQADFVRCIVDSLAVAYRAAFADAQRLSGTEVDVVHVVGGGARNELLCQLTADACGVPVVAGPVEAAAIGNVLVQARALGAVGGSLESMRALIRDTHDLRRYEPRGDQAPWRDAAERIGLGR